MKVIGLTGGIGSGKSTLLDWFKSKGIPCFESDLVGKQLLETQLKGLIGNRFGASLYNTDGTLDRKALAKKVFGDTKALADLNQIVHPAVASAFEVFKQAHKDDPFVIKEAAILFETEGHKNCDAVILVVAPKAQRIKRVRSRDSISAADVLARIKHQWTDEQKRVHADYVIENIKLDKAYEQADTILKKLLE